MYMYMRDFLLDIYNLPDILINTGWQLSHLDTIHLVHFRGKPVRFSVISFQEHEQIRQTWALSFCRFQSKHTDSGVF